ncbi:40S ribosomal protein S5-1 [Hordeum vulgare]|nr:40S ribosomal protein S5-1 [Hordeum vulgare]
MASSSSSKDKFFEKVINPYLPEVMKHPRTIEMCDGVLYIQDVQGMKKMATVEARLEAVGHEVFKCQGMVEHELSANHNMINVDGRPLEDIVFTLNDQINFLQGQVFDLQNQIFEYETRFHGLS